MNTSLGNTTLGGFVTTQSQQTAAIFADKVSPIGREFKLWTSSNFGVHLSPANQIKNFIVVYNMNTYL